MKAIIDLINDYFSYLNFLHHHVINRSHRKKTCSVLVWLHKYLLNSILDSTGRMPQELWDLELEIKETCHFYSGIYLQSPFEFLLKIKEYGNISLNH